MPHFDTAALESDGTDRDVRALTEYLTVLSEAPDLYTVVSQSGVSYIVDARDGACECPDATYRGVTCKHQRRVAYATGERPIPAWVDAKKADDHLGAHVETTPRMAATDGGAVVTGDDRSDTDERPDDCGCWDVEQNLPCWPCYCGGFDTPNPCAGAGE